MTGSKAPIPGFDPQPVLESRTIALKPLTHSDFPLLFAAASDPEIWAGHPAKDRYQRDVFTTYFQTLLASRATLTINDNPSQRMIGCSRYYVAPDMPEAIAIGFTFLTREFWGGATNFAVKQLMLDHAFLSFENVWFHIDPANVRSQKATQKLGAEFRYDARLNLGGVPAQWKCFSLSKAVWQARVNE